MAAGNVFGTFTADLWDNTATCITRGVKGQRFMSPCRVTGCQFFVLDQS